MHSPKWLHREGIQVLPERQKDGAYTDAKHGRCCSCFDQNAQLPVKRVQSPESVILEEQHLTRVTIKQPAETAINEKGTH